MEAMLFELMRSQILAIALNPATNKAVTQASAYAWQYRLYPVADGTDLHRKFGPLFTIPEAQVAELRDYLDGRWRANQHPTFYQLEDHYQHSESWDRCKLIEVCRYFFLAGLFDQDFWRSLLIAGQFPVEAGGIADEFDPVEDLSLT